MQMYVAVEDGDEEEGGRRRGLTEEQLTKAIAHFIETNPPPGVLPLGDVEPAAIILMGKVINVEREYICSIVQ
jgi:hypothetical protein